MELKPLVLQIAIFAGIAGIPLTGILLVSGHSREALGLLFGLAVGTVNQMMIAFRVARIGQVGGRRQTILFIQTGTALRYVMIGAAAAIALREPATLSFGGLVGGLVLTMIVGAVVGARMVLR